MKVIKRNGDSVDFDQTKIEIAISKANTEVKPSERATKEDIQNIIEYILSLDKKRMLVEDIQDEIDFYKKEYDRELEQCQKANKWLDELRDSLNNC